MKVFVAKTEEKLSKMLLREYSGSLSFARLNKLFRNKDIKVNGKRINKDLFVSQGDEITVYYDGEVLKLSFEIVYQDDNILVAKKPKGVTSENFFESVKTKFDELYFCHRLDRNTDGVMIFAKNQKSYDCIYNGFVKKNFEKYYECEVFGNVKENKSRLIDYLCKDEKLGVVSVVKKGVLGSLKAELEYEVIKRKENSTLLRVRLLTGRTHQIRVQLANAGHFILGDDKYGNRKESEGLGVRTLSLSAKKLVLRFAKDSFLGYLDEKTFEIS